jgi:hypothetical protein
MIDFGPQSAPAQSLLHAVIEGRVQAATAWHCCLEFFSWRRGCHRSFAWRRTMPSRCSSRRCSGGCRCTTCLQRSNRHAAAGAHDGIAGGRIYDAHIAEVARAARASVIVTDNRRHFLSALRYDVRVETPTEFLAGMKKSK